MEQKYNFNGLGPVPPPPRISGGELLSFSGSSGGVVQNEPVSVGTVLPQAIATQTKYPFDVSKSGSSTSPTLSLWPGLVNGILASNIYGSFTVDATSLWYIKAACTSDGTQITAATIVVDTSAPYIQTPATDAMPREVDVLVGLFKAGISYNIAQRNVALTPSTVSSADGHYSGVWIPS